MAQFTSYCEAVASGKLHSLHKRYHDEAYGFPIEDDQELFKRLMLEINQAGLSWEIILKKEAGFDEAYDAFDIDKVAGYNQLDVKRLKEDQRIIRNSLKINAAIHNAQTIQKLRQSHGSFKAWLDAHHPLGLQDWVKLFKKTFKFTGGEITNEFLMSIGYLKGAHTSECPIYFKVLKTNPTWHEKKIDEQA
jgi:DNA-3-methyladenine glycosylase I